MESENNKEILWNSEYIKIMLNNFGMYFAFYLLTPLLPLYLHDTFGATKDTIGVVLSGYTITALMFRPFSGFLVDAFSRKKMLMLFPFRLFHLLRRLSACVNAAALCHCANAARHTVRRLNGGLFNGCHRRAAAVTSQRGYWLLRPEQ